MVRISGKNMIHFIFIADMHAITMPIEAEKLKRKYTKFSSNIYSMWNRFK